MRLATIETSSGPRAVALHGAHYVDLHATDPSIPAGVRAILAQPQALWAAARALERPDAVRHPAAQARHLPPIPDPEKIICIGLNYRDHAAETGAPLPREPVLF